MENRYKLPKGLQRKYLLEVEKVSSLSVDELAKLFSIVGRSYRDWRREKYTITQKAVDIIEKRYNLPFPYPKDQAMKTWRVTKLESSRKGGKATVKKYGSPGTPEGRKRGGKHGLAVLRARGLIPQPKPFIGPKDYSTELAEFIGILLGDGHIGKEQWSITINSIVDKEYSTYIFNLIHKLFGFEPYMAKRKNMNAIVICGSGIGSIQYFQKLGLKIGNKIKQQVGVPKWIQNNDIFRKSCLRGLMDTDGGVFVHRYKVNGKEYKYQKLCFVNRSIPLLNYVFETLNILKLTPKMITKVENKRVWLYNHEEVIKYLEVVGTSNSRLLKYSLIKGGVR